MYTTVVPATSQSNLLPLIMRSMIIIICDTQSGSWMHGIIFSFSVGTSIGPLLAAPFVGSEPQISLGSTGRSGWNEATKNRILTGRQRAARWYFYHLQHRINSVQEKLLTVTLVTVTQYRAIWLQWHFPDFPISNLMVKFSCLQWHSISHSLTVTLFGRSWGCHCNRLLLYKIGK